MAGLLDVAIIRLTSTMRAEYPGGWRQLVLRLEPFWLIGRRSDLLPETASFRDRPVEVFGDPPRSGLFNAHGEYLALLESKLGVSFRWQGNPGTFEQREPRMLRETGPRYPVEFDSYARRYREIGYPASAPRDLQPVYPWSIVWREETLTSEITRFLDVAIATSDASNWLNPEHSAPLWAPEMPD